MFHVLAVLTEGLLVLLRSGSEHFLSLNKEPRVVLGSSVSDDLLPDQGRVLLVALVGLRVSLVLIHRGCHRSVLVSHYIGVLVGRVVGSGELLLDAQFDLLVVRKRDQQLLAGLSLRRVFVQETLKTLLEDVVVGEPFPDLFHLDFKQIPLKRIPSENLAESFVAEQLQEREAEDKGGNQLRLERELLSRVPLDLVVDLGSQTEVLFAPDELLDVFLDGVLVFFELHEKLEAVRVLRVLVDLAAGDQDHF